MLLSMLPEIIVSGYLEIKKPFIIEHKNYFDETSQPSVKVSGSSIRLLPLTMTDSEVTLNVHYIIRLVIIVGRTMCK